VNAADNPHNERLNMKTTQNLSDMLAEIQTQNQMIDGARKAASRLMITNSDLIETLKRINRTSVKETFHGDVDQFQTWLDAFTADAISKWEAK